MADEILQNTSDTAASYSLVNIEQSNINDSILAQDIRVAIEEYCSIIVDCSIFNTNVNKDGIKSMLISFFEDLYINEPEDVLNYIGQKPSGKLINTIFSRYGIDDKFTKEYPELLKTKTAYMLNNLTATKGSIETFKYFNDILSEFYKDINFYKVVVDIRSKGNRYDSSSIIFKYFGSNNGNTLSTKYLKDDGVTYPIPSTINDNDIELKFFITYNKAKNLIEYDVRLFDVQKDNVYLKFDTMNDNDKIICIPRGETSVIYKKLAFDTSAIKEYNKPEIISCFYNNPSYYDLTTDEQLLGQLDTHIEVNILTYVTSYNASIPSKVRYIIDFGKAHPYDIKFSVNKLSSRDALGKWVHNYITLKEGETKYDTGEIELSAEELSLEANDKQQTRSYNDLIFRLEPILINNPDAIQTEVNSGILLSRKFLMNKIDFFDQDVDNMYKRNLFPISTNVIHMQLGASVTIDNTKMHPDLVRMYGMTYLHNNQIMKFAIDGQFYKLNIQDYCDVLSFIKMQQLKITTGKDFKNDNPVPYYYQYKLPIDKLKEIYDLHLYYMGMPLQYKYFAEFKDRFNKLLFTQNQQVVPTIKSMGDFIVHLKGNAPATMTEMYKKIKNEFPISVNFAEGRDQNLQLLNIVNKIRYDYEIADNDIEGFFQLLSTISIEDSLTTVSVYDNIKSKFNIKYPRLVAQITSIKTIDEIVELYLYNYKIALEYASKMDNLVEYFINDLYQLYMQSTAFKKRFFDPVLNLFEQYFFKAEQIYRTEQGISEMVKDKTNVVLTDDNFAIQVSRERVYSIIQKRGWFEIMVNHKQIKDNHRVKINDNFTVEVYDRDKLLKSKYDSDREVWVE